MKETFDQLFKLMQTTTELSPWVAQLTIEKAAQELRSEVDELLEALKNNDLENFKEEMGDIINDAFLLLIVSEKEKGIVPKEIVTEGINKIYRRKPFLAEGRKATLNEEYKVWCDAKLKEGKTLRAEEIAMINKAVQEN